MSRPLSLLLYLPDASQFQHRCLLCFAPKPSCKQIDGTTVHPLVRDPPSCTPVSIIAKSRRPAHFRGVSEGALGRCRCNLISTTPAGTGTAEAAHARGGRLGSTLTPAAFVPEPPSSAASRSNGVALMCLGGKPTTQQEKRPACPKPVCLAKVRCLLAVLTRKGRPEPGLCLEPSWVIILF